MTDLHLSNGWRKSLNKVLKFFNTQNSPCKKSILQLDTQSKIHLPGKSKKYTRLMSRNTASLSSILKIRLGLDT